MRRTIDSDRSRIVFRTWGLEMLRSEAKSFLNRYDFSQLQNDINDVLELYNVYIILMIKINEEFCWWYELEEKKRNSM